MDAKIFKRICLAYVRAQLECLYLLKDIDRLKNFQRRATKSVRILENYTYEDRPKMLKLHLQKEK